MKIRTQAVWLRGPRSGINFQIDGGNFIEFRKAFFSVNHTQRCAGVHQHANRSRLRRSRLFVVCVVEKLVGRTRRRERDFLTR